MAKEVAASGVQLGHAPATSDAIHNAGAVKVGAGAAIVAGYAMQMNGLLNIVPLASPKAYSLVELHMHIEHLQAN